MNNFSDRRRPVAYVVSQELVKVASLLPSNKNRSLLVHSLISAFRLSAIKNLDGSKALQVLKPIEATQKDLSAYHGRDYLDYVLDPKSSSGHNFGATRITAEFGLEDDCPLFAGLPAYIRLVAGASLSSTSILRQDKADIAICWDGGRHHAQKSHAAGFCYVADCVLVILALKKAILGPADKLLTPSMRKPRVMYLDLDLHFSDAVSQAFHSTGSSTVPQVMTFSIHYTAPGFFPVSPLSALSSVADLTFDPFSLSLPLRQGASNATFARVWPIIERVRSIFKPDYVVVQCGVDGLAGDPCATWNWSLGGEGSMGWCLARIIENWPGKKLLLGGGGYNSPNAARAWTYLTSIAMGKPLSLESEIPDHQAFPLYGHSFTLDVPAGNMRDQNSEEYLKSAEESFDLVIKALEKRLCAA